MKGWKHIASSNNYYLQHNNEFVELGLTFTASISGSWSELLRITYDEFKPSREIKQVGLNQTVVRVTSDGIVQIARADGTTTSTSVVNTFIWRKK